MDIGAERDEPKRRAEGGYSDRMRTLVGVLLALVAGIALVACGSSTDEAGPTTQTSTTETLASDPSREPAPAIEGETLDGAAIALADFRGKPVLVNVWSSW